LRPERGWYADRCLVRLLFARDRDECGEADIILEKHWELL